jgi:hypothetical protein
MSAGACPITENQGRNIQGIGKASSLLLAGADLSSSAAEWIAR